LLLLMIHGLLHLHGLDHETDRGQMLVLQRRLFAEHAGELP
jgi:ssRNA-specific RNase YbeY (16S rRNA maturation enzyme)